MTWTPERNEQLRTLWNEGESTQKIAATMGLTRNQVIGKAHRMGLDGRPSPIIRPVVQRVSVPALAHGTCRFIAGDPQIDPTPCGQPASSGSPYCREHHARCYQTETALEKAAAA